MLRFPNLTDKDLPSDAFSEIEAQMRPAVSLSATGKDVGLTQSRLGGTPAWPEDREVLRDTTGTRLIFLAQINCEDLSLPDFPTKGVIQFFIGSDDLYGCAFPTISDGADSGADFRVIFHEDPSILRPCLNYYKVMDLYNVDHPFTTKDWTKASVGLLAQPAQMAPHPSCKQGEDLVNKLDDEFDLDGYDVLEGGYPEAHVGGYPIYTQSDIAYEPEHAEFDTVLLSIGSPQDIVMFGDAGRANFLISKADLIRCDFTRVAYTWDCH